MRFRIWPFAKKGEDQAINEEKSQTHVCPKCKENIVQGAPDCPKCGEPIVETSPEVDKSKRLKITIILVLRDIALALIVVAIILAIIFAYTGVWPPMVVVESNSMQHGDEESFIGVIDTGDLVLVKLTPQRSDIITWVEGKASQHSTYSDYGDVIIFHRPGSSTPIIHRALFWMEYNSTNRSFNIPDLERLPVNLVWGGTNADNSPVTSPYNLNGTIWINNAGWSGRLNITFRIGSQFLSYQRNGYVTMGDNNAHNGGGYDPYLVRQEDILGKARGELPWFGLLKLTLFPAGGACCDGWGDPSAPRNSWDSLVVALVLMIATPILIDIATTLWNRRKKSLASSKSTDEKSNVLPPNEKIDEVSKEDGVKEVENYGGEDVTSDVEDGDNSTSDNYEAWNIQESEEDSINRNL